MKLDRKYSVFFIKGAVLFFLIFAVIFSCRRKTPLISDFTFQGMGTVLTVMYVGKKDSDLEKLLKEDVRYIEKLFSYYNENSFVSKLNEFAHINKVEVPQEVCELIVLSIEMGRKTDNYFDITYKSKGKVWDEKRENIPKKEELEKLSHLVGYRNIEADCEKGKIKFLKEGVIIDMGGVAKGYSIDRAGDIMKRNGVNNFIINYGGDMLICGDKKGQPWEIGIKDPDSQGKILKKISIKGGETCTAIATSGKYERFKILEGTVYSHIINPGSGMPANEAKSVTVVGENATEVDVLATAISASDLDEMFIKKIVDKFSVKIYTLSDSGSVWKEYGTEKQQRKVQK